MNAYRFPMPKSTPTRRIMAASIAIRESCSEDEDHAEDLAAAKGKAGNVDAVGAELIRMCIVEMNGKPVQQPFAAWDKWNNATKSAASAFYRAVNSVAKDEINPLIEAAVPLVLGGEKQPSSAAESAAENSGEDG